jgi:hypothetical protein
MQPRWLTAVEIACAFVAAALFTRACADIHASSIDRIGQVSGMSTIAMRFLLVAVPLVAALAISARWREGVHFERVTRFVCAIFAGLGSATFAAGVLFALRGTPFGLGGTSGDAGTLAQWADIIKSGSTEYSSVYPPLQVYFIVWISDVLHIPTTHAVKVFQVIGVAAIGPASYAAWRLLMRPPWALALAIISMLPLIEPYRPYAGLVLTVLVPVLLKFLDVLRDLEKLSIQRTLQYAAAFGLGLGLLCLLYSGWYQWSAPGFVVAALIVFPWRYWRRGILFCGVAGLVFGLCVLRYVMGFAAGSGVKDSYFYVDAVLEPTYYVSWRGGEPTDVHWQPLGELGGIGVFALLLTAGLGIALAHGRRQTAVIGLVCIVAGCWLMRLWTAHNMWSTKLVQLWPRTSAEILCCMLVLCVFAVYLLAQRTDDRSPWRSPFTTIGAVSSLVLVIMSSSAATTDQYVPRNMEHSTGGLAWMAQRLARKKPSVTPGAQITVSSAVEGSDPRALIDGDYTTFFSAVPSATDHEETIEMHWERTVHFSHVILYPAKDGFPLDLEISVWDGTKWLMRRDIRYVPSPYKEWVIELFDEQVNGDDYTTGFRMRVKRQRQDAANQYVMKLAEIELR